MRNARLWRLIAGALSSPWTLFTVAFLVRVIVAGQLLPAHAARGFYEQNEPARIAWNVVSGKGFSSPWPHTPLAPTAQQPPVYPYLLAGIFKLTGPYTYTSLCLAVALNAIFSALTAVLILKLGKRWFGPFVAVVAAWIWALWLYEVVVSIRLWESALSGLLLVLGLWLLGKLSDAAAMPHWLLFGGLAGVAALTNTTLLPVFACCWVWLWIVQRGASRKPWLASVAICLLVLAPWTLRNYATFHRLIPVRDNFGLELWIGNHEGVTHLYDFRGGFPLVDPTEYNQLGEIRFMESKRAVAMEFIRQHPGEFVRLCGQRLVSFWTAPNAFVWLPISLLAGLGAMLALWRKGIGVAPYAIGLGIFPLVYYVTHPWSTYRHPIEPVMILLAVYAVSEVGNVLRVRKSL
ncbi:MAG: glycosyltransferase family 39 protein [Acidobacteriia bacterium]|nr:glycosyltransferase family 39 protein [Terriglobia bacterium]